MTLRNYPYDLGGSTQSIPYDEGAYQDFAQHDLVTVDDTGKIVGLAAKSGTFNSTSTTMTDTNAGTATFQTAGTILGIALRAGRNVAAPGTTLKVPVVPLRNLDTFTLPYVPAYSNLEVGQRYSLTRNAAGILLVNATGDTSNPVVVCVDKNPNIASTETNAPALFAVISARLTF